MRLNGISKEKFAEELSKLIYDCLARQGERRSQLFTDVMDTARSYELEEQALAMAHGICLKEGEPDLWELPKPFDNALSLPKLTERCLPPKLWEYLQAVSEYVQVASEMCVLPLLSVLSLCVQGKAVISNSESDSDTHTEPLNLYCMTIAAPGERKSGCFKEFVFPLMKYQREFNDSRKTVIQEYRTQRAFLERQRDNAIKKGDLKKAQEHTRQLAELKEVRELRLTTGDCTSEALAIELKEQGERIGVLDDEGVVFEIAAGLYSNNQTNLDLYLKAYDGSSYSVLRKGSGSIALYRPLLTFGLMVQHQLYEKAISNEQFRGRGFIHRFMFSFPESKAGYLSFQSPVIDPKLRYYYNDLVRNLLVMPYHESNVPVIRLSHESFMMFKDYFDSIQEEMQQNGLFANMREWASKQFGRALRIAGIFHMVVSGGDVTAPVSYKTAEQAIALSRWQEAQAFHALSGEGADNEVVRNAKLLLDKLKGLKVTEIGKREMLMKKITRLSSTELQEPLELLEELNYIKIIDERPNGTGRHKTTIKVNPNIIS